MIIFYSWLQNKTPSIIIEQIVVKHYIMKQKQGRRLMSETIMTKDLSTVTDKKYNNQLFYVYQKLIPPFEDIENKSREIAQLEMKISKNKSKKLAKSLVPVWIISSLFFVCTGLLNMVPIIGHLLQWVKTMNEDIYWIAYMLCSFLLPFISLLVTQLIVCFSIASKQETKMEELKRYVNELCTQYEKYIQFVPPSYRYSHALHHFVNSYVNGKVENTKEAMISYDEYMHRLKMETTHKQMINQLEIIQNQQAIILKQQGYIQNQLDVDSAMIILSMFK